MQQTLFNIVELVKTTDADALLCGGDLYKHDRFSPETAALVRYTFELIDPVLFTGLRALDGRHDLVRLS